MKSTIAITALILMTMSAQGQFQLRKMTITLSPIVVENGKYYFDGRRVHFDEVVMPLVAVNDPVINHRLKVLETLKDIRRPIILAPLVYVIISSSSGTRHRYRTFKTNETILLGSLGAVLLMDGINAIIRKKTINRYNDIVLQPTASIDSRSLMVGMAIRFP